MTEGIIVTVQDLLPANLKGMDEVIETALGKEGNVGFPGFAWKVIGSEANDALRGTLNGDEFELLARGWCAARELHKYTDRVEHPLGERSVVFLGEHTLVSNAYPVIIVTVGPTQYPPLRLTLELKAIFRTAALTIQDGHIRTLSAGDCSVSAQLKYGEFKLHDELKSRDVTLPGKLEFKAPGLAIQ
jgi:hypothetical protein